MLAGSHALSNVAQPARRRPYLILVGTAVLIFGLDHLTKWLVATHIPLGGKIGANSPISIDHVRNSGAAFGLFPQFHWLYLVVAAIVGAYILYAGRRFGTSWWRQAVLGLILGGAVSNGVDRLLYGYVVDFVDVHWWPVFNVADSAIVVGVLVAVLSFRPRAIDARRRARAHDDDG
jgi:signal peptidase II